MDADLIKSLMSRIEELEGRLKKMEQNEMIDYILKDPKFYDRQDDVLAARLNALLSHLNVKITVEMTHDYEEKQHKVDKVHITDRFLEYTRDADCEALGPG